MNASASAETPIQKLVEIIEREAQKRFSDAMVERVLVDDSDGDLDTLKIFVVLSDPDAVDPRKVVNFIGHIRNALESELSDDRFPLVSYFSKGEAAELFPEAG